MSPHFFIDRPIFASVLSIIIVVVGLVSLHNLPIAQFPQITPPMVQIRRRLSRGQREVVAEAVARPIEVQLPGSITFCTTIPPARTTGNDDEAHVRNRNRCGYRTGPDAKPATPCRAPVARRSHSPRYNRKKDFTGSAGGHCAELHRSTHDTVFLSNYALLRVLDSVKRLPGVGDAIIFRRPKLLHAD